MSTLTTQLLGLFLSKYRETSNGAALEHPIHMPARSGVKHSGMRRSEMRKSRAGFTVTELMLSIALLTAGVAGVAAMQRATSAANQHARSLATATRVAQSWLDRLDADATKWNPTFGLINTEWARQVDTEIDWFLPAWDQTLTFGPAFDAQGALVPQAQLATDAAYCVHLKLERMLPIGTKAGADIMRAQVRVVWPRRSIVSGSGATQQAHPCLTDPKTINSATNRQAYHQIVLTSALRQNGQIQ